MIDWILSWFAPAKPFDPRPGDHIEWNDAGTRLRGTFVQWCSTATFICERRDGTQVSVSLYDRPIVIEREVEPERPQGYRGE